MSVLFLCFIAFFLASASTSVRNCVVCVVDVSFGVTREDVNTAVVGPSGDGKCSRKLLLSSNIKMTDSRRRNCKGR